MVRISFDQKPFRKLMMQVWGAKCIASPSTETKAGRDDPGQRCRTRRAAWASPSARPSRRPSPTRRARRATRWAACSTTSCCTRRSSAWRPRSSLQKAGEKNAGRRHRLRRRRQQLRGTRLPVRGRQDQRRQDRDHARRAGGLPDDDPRAVRLRPRRHRRHDAAAGHAHAGPRLRAAADPRRRAALPRHGAAGQPGASWRGCSSRGPIDQTEVLRGGHDLGQDRRAPSAPRRPATPSPPSSTRPRRPARKARRR